MGVGRETSAFVAEAYARPKNSGTLLTTGGTALATFINEWSAPVTPARARLRGVHVRAHPAAQAERVRVLPQAEGLRGGRVVLGRDGERDRRKVSGGVGIDVVGGGVQG